MRIDALTLPWQAWRSCAILRAGAAVYQNTTTDARVRVHYCTIPDSYCPKHIVCVGKTPNLGLSTRFSLECDRTDSAPTGLVRHVMSPRRPSRRGRSTSLRHDSLHVALYRGLSASTSCRCLVEANNTTVIVITHARHVASRTDARATGSPSCWTPASDESAATRATATCTAIQEHDFTI